MYMLPFTPARGVDEHITQLIDSLRGPVLESPSKSSDRKQGKGKKKQVAGAGGSDADPLMPSTGWEYDGPLRAEWQARNRCVADRRPIDILVASPLTAPIFVDSRGRLEMQRLIDSWPQMTDTALRAYKTRICGHK